jgi:hypothetical protein
MGTPGRKVWSRLRVAALAGIVMLGATAAVGGSIVHVSPASAQAKKASHHHHNQQNSHKGYTGGTSNSGNLVNVDHSLNDVLPDSLNRLTLHVLGL